MVEDWLSNAYAGMSQHQVVARMSLVGTNLPGFARASNSGAGDIVTTSQEGLFVNDSTVMAGEFAIPIYEARPLAVKKYPLLIVIPEIFGMHEHIKDVTRRFAKEGFSCITFEPYARDGGVLHLPDIPSVRKVADTIPDIRVMEDIDAILGYAQEQPTTRNDQVGITGFCRGGMYTLLYAAHNNRVKAAVAWYGQIKPERALGIRSIRPIDVVAKINAPILGLYGAEDAGIPVADVKEMEQAFRSLRKTAEFVIYAGVPHAFFADYRPSYRADAAKDAWGRCVTWLKKYLKG
ncbi:MAG TPA: dienelactone hydrolase family protein [Nitrospirota bacterium]|nr:dienelactone hydrolase family protein [Nitrospirota bacterium]